MILALFSNYGPNTCTCIWLSVLKVVPSSNVKLNETITISWTIRASQSAMCSVLENDGALLHNATYTNCEITCTESIQKVITSMLFLTCDYNKWNNIPAHANNVHWPMHPFTLFFWSMTMYWQLKLHNWEICCSHTNLRWKNQCGHEKFV